MKVFGLDLYNFAITGDKACNMNANSNMSANHAGPTLLILNDQGGSVMDISVDVTATLRAQDHGHPPVACYSLCNHDSSTNEKITETLRAECHGAIPVVCFEPGIARREGSNSRFVTDRCVTLRAEMGDNQPAICFQQNQREEVRNMGEQAGALTAESGMHNTNYVCYEVPDG